jgi:hypothetical protein
MEQQSTYGSATKDGATFANGQTEEKARSYAARRFNPGYHYIPELAGWYDTDEECEELNRADDLLKMIQGDWNWTGRAGQELPIYGPAQTQFRTFLNLA